MRALIGLLGGTLLLALLAGCGSVATGPAVRQELAFTFTPEQKSAIAAADARSYAIRRGDVLSVRDLFNENLNQDHVLVLPDGTASFFGLAPRRVEGMTVASLGEALTAEYGKEFREPRISVAVAELGSNDVYVLGEVNQPGRYPLPTGGFTILGAIAEAGGFANHGNKGAVVLVRLTPDGYLCREMDLSRFASGASFDPALADLRPFDVIYVSRTAIGDFASFTTSLVGSLLQYTQMAVDVKYITEGDVFRR